MNKSIKQAIIKLTVEEINEANKLISVHTLHRKYKDGSVIDSWTVYFEDGCQADIKLVQADSICYIDPVLFDENGCELIAGSPDKESIIGEYYFGTDYMVRIEAA
jgi:hypothetical protein